MPHSVLHFVLKLEQILLLSVHVLFLFELEQQGFVQSAAHNDFSFELAQQGFKQSAAHDEDFLWLQLSLDLQHSFLVSSSCGVYTGL